MRAARQIEQALAHAHALARGGGLRAAGAAQHRLDPGQQGARLVGLGDVVVGAGFETDDLVDRVVARRHHDDAHPAAALAQVAGEREAVLAAGQAQIEQHQGGRILLDQFAQRRAGFDARRAIALVVEEIDEGFALKLFVLHHDDVGTGILGPGRHRPILPAESDQSQGPRREDGAPGRGAVLYGRRFGRGRP